MIINVNPTMILYITKPKLLEPSMIINVNPTMILYITTIVHFNRSGISVDVILYNIYTTVFIRNVENLTQLGPSAQCPRQ
jgi:hypothetical protein